MATISQENRRGLLFMDFDCVDASVALSKINALQRRTLSSHDLRLLLDLHFQDCVRGLYVRGKDSIEVFASGSSVFSTAFALSVIVVVSSWFGSDENVVRSSIFRSFGISNLLLVK